MKKLTSAVALFLLINASYANGLLTNTNQSTQFVRMMSRNASIGIDGVYYNPAGLIKLDDGWHFSFNNQSIFQTITIVSEYPLLNKTDNSIGSVYEGKIDMPFFPSGFAVYKKNKWAFSFGFGPNVGGGTTKYDRGLPSFEIPISQVVPQLSGLGQIDPSYSVTGYDTDLTLDLSTVVWGFQLGATYKISEMFSVSAGLRYTPAKNIYDGSIKNNQLEVAGVMEDAPDWLNDKAKIAQAGADMPKTLQPLIDNGGGSYTLAELESNGTIEANERIAIESGLQLMGLSDNQIDAMNLYKVQGAYTLASPTFQSTADQLTNTADQLEDKIEDVEQNGDFFTPIIGVNIMAGDNFNIGLKYEHKTYLGVINKTTTDDLGLFKDGGKSGNDIPGIIAGGIGYTNKNWLEAQLSYNMYLDKYVYGDVVEHNSFDIALGTQINVNKKFSFSAGCMYQKADFSESYNIDRNFVPPSYIALGGGIMWKITKQMTFDAGVSNIMYKDANGSFYDSYLNTNYNETYSKKSMSFAVGLSYSIF
jgi:long-chain fatty acid transport protein